MSVGRSRRFSTLDGKCGFLHKFCCRYPGFSIYIFFFVFAYRSMINSCVDHLLFVYVLRWEGAYRILRRSISLLQDADHGSRSLASQKSGSDVRRQLHSFTFFDVEHVGSKTLRSAVKLIYNLVSLGHLVVPNRVQLLPFIPHRPLVRLPATSFTSPRLLRL